MAKGFALNHDKCLQFYFCVKCQIKKIQTKKTQKTTLSERCQKQSNLYIAIWASTWQNLQNCMCTQLWHLPTLIRVFAVSMKAWVLSCPQCTQQRLWADWANENASDNCWMGGKHAWSQSLLFWSDMAVHILRVSMILWSLWLNGQIQQMMRRGILYFSYFSWKQRRWYTWNNCFLVKYFKLSSAENFA